MPSQLLISDANVLIDLKTGGIIEAIFELDYDYAVPSLLFEQELRENHAEFLDQGLKLLELTPGNLQESEEFMEKHTGISSFDAMALILAREKQARLLTGDKKLKQVCEAENVTVNGTLWLVEQLLDENHIRVEAAEEAYHLMEADGSRLPRGEIEKQLKRHR